MLGSYDLIAFGATTDPLRAVAFYRDVLGLALASDEPYALVFDAHGTMLRIQKAPHHEPAPHTLLGWKVPDIEHCVDALVAKGVVLVRYEGFDQDARGIWSAPGGTRVAWFRDPDGNLLSLTQL